MIDFVMPYELKTREERMEYLFELFDKYEEEQGKIARSLNVDHIYAMHEHTRRVFMQLKNCIKQAERIEGVENE